MTGAEDSEVQEHFWKTAFPEQENVDSILDVLASNRHEGLTEDNLEVFVNMRPRDIVKVSYKVLSSLLAAIQMS